MHCLWCLFKECVCFGNSNNKNNFNWGHSDNDEVLGGVRDGKPKRDQISGVFNNGDRTERKTKGGEA